LLITVLFEFKMGAVVRFRGVFFLALRFFLHFVELLDIIISRLAHGRFYIARPPIALERLHLNQRGQVVYVLKKPYSDGTTHIVMTQLELLERLASLVPRPRIHLTRFAGVFAPHYKYRAMVVPKPQVKLEPTKECKPSKSRISWAMLLKRVFNIDVETCSLCQGRMKIIAAIEDPPVIKKILEHLGLPSRRALPWPARGPPGRAEEDFEDFQQFPIFEPV
jgi:hypothetical protein